MNAADAVASNRETLKKLVVVAALMFGFGWALVPFYKKICEVTGINNFVEADKAPVNSQVDLTRSVTVEFDANATHMPWQFRPLTNGMDIHPGQLTTVMYEVVNAQGYPVTGQALPSYAPREAQRYFKKLECFCFTQQTLQAHETKRFPVVFLIDPELPKDVKTITLSYTFFQVAGKGGAS
jgi:cytochrome c oxidase assembly protein subunit 11